MATHAGTAESITSRAVTPPRGDFSGALTGLGNASSGEAFGGPRVAEGATR